MHFCLRVLNFGKLEERKEGIFCIGIQGGGGFPSAALHLPSANHLHRSPACALHPSVDLCPTALPARLSSPVVSSGLQPPWPPSAPLSATSAASGRPRILITLAHFRTSPAVSGQLRPSPATYGRLRPPPAVTGRLRPPPAAYGRHGLPPAVTGRLRPSPAVSGRLRTSSAITGYLGSLRRPRSPPATTDCLGSLRRPRRLGFHQVPCLSCLGRLWSPRFPPGTLPQLPRSPLVASAALVALGLPPLPSAAFGWLRHLSCLGHRRPPPTVSAASAASGGLVALVSTRCLGCLSCLGFPWAPSSALRCLWPPPTPTAASVTSATLDASGCLLEVKEAHEIAVRSFSERPTTITLKFPEFSFF
ncbi:uncharacterized protein LOC144706523 [Wolffia australiana]